MTTTASATTSLDLFAVYLLLGLLMMMMVLSVLYDIPELNLGFHFYLKNDNPDEEQTRLRADTADTSGGTAHKYQKQVDDAESLAARGGNGSGGTYQSFQDKDVEEGAE